MLLRMPGIKHLLLDLSAIEYLRSALVLCEAGFVPLDALTQAAKSVPNRYARTDAVAGGCRCSAWSKDQSCVAKVRIPFSKLGHAIDRVGEQTGGLTQACLGATRLVKRRLENRINAALGILEPAMTISLAICVGWIVLAIYMPMFRMFDVLDF